MKIIVPDASFYIYFQDEINRPDGLNFVLRNYSAYIGNKLKQEVVDILKKDVEMEELVIDAEEDFEVDFSNLLKGFYNFLRSEYPEIKDDITDGEFEAMGISYYLKTHKNFNYLIIDDQNAYYFAKKNLDFISNDVVRTLRFLFNSHVKDSNLEKEFVIGVFRDTKSSIDNGEKPLNISKETWDSEIEPLFQRLKEV